MIEFTGQVSGVAEKFLWRKGRKSGLVIMYLSMLIVSPLFFVFFGGFGYSFWQLLGMYLILVAFVTLCAFIPHPKKERKRLLPIRIYTEKGYVYCIFHNKSYNIQKKISDCKKMVDHGEFYELVYTVRGGGICDWLICQKNLLSSGSLKAFEELFEGKIERKLPKKKNKNSI